MGNEKVKKGAKLSSANWIVKSNALNEIRHTKMTITQMRLFSIYLSKINPKDIASREVTFKLDDYMKIMEFNQLNISQLKHSAEDLISLSVIFYEDDKDGGFTATSSLLFKRFKLYKNDDGDWLVTVDCHNDVLKLMFELKRYYFKYKLWNALQLTSANQQRMYELLKQYENAGAREISVKDLREFLGLKPDEYPRWDNFRTRILEASQVALKNYTDIEFTWDISGKRGKGGKINALRFYITKNESYMRQLTIDEYLSEQGTPIVEDTEEFECTEENDIYTFLAEACENEFNIEEISLLHSYIAEITPMQDTHKAKMYMYEFLQRQYKELNVQAQQTDIKRRFSYLKQIIKSEINKKM